MRKGAFLVVVLLLIAQSLFSNSTKSYIVKLKEGKKSAQLLSSDFILESPFPAELYQKIASSHLSNYYVVSNPESIDEQQFVNMLTASGQIEYIEPNYTFKIEQAITPNDNYYAKQWALQTINAPEAWEISTGKDVIVAVVDTGIDFYHPEFQGQLWVNTPEDANGNGTFEPWATTEEREGIKGDIDGKDNDGNGYVDDVLGYDFVDQDIFVIGDYSENDPDPTDEHSHGTSVSGIIAAKVNNEIGIAGIAYDSKIMSLRAFNYAGDGESDDIAAAIIYAAENGANVINMSFGEFNDSRFFRDAVEYATNRGCVAIASSGNNNDTYKHYPSDYSNVISVGSIMQDNQKSGTSNYGSRLNITAPGTAIWTTDINGAYKEFAGTSASAPHVSAAAALLKSYRPELTPEEVKGILIASSQDAGDSGWDEKFAAGILDLEKMLNYQGKVHIEITTPENELHINRDETPVITAKGFAIHPLFDSLQILFGTGRAPQKWNKIGTTVKAQVKGETLGSIDTRKLIDTIFWYNSLGTIVDTVITADTLYSVALKVFLKGHKTLEDRVYLDLYSNDTKMQLLKTAATNIYSDRHRKILITATSNRNSHVEIKYHKVGESDEIKNADNFNVATLHEIMLEDLTPNVQYEGRVYAYYKNLDTVSEPVQFMLKDDDFYSDNFTFKNSIPQRLFLCRETVEIDGERTLLANDFTNLRADDAVLFAYRDGLFVKTDSLLDGGIFVGVGETNANGKTETMAYNYGITTVYEKETNQSLFENETFHSPTDWIAWGSQLFDIDNDGLDEVFMKNDTSFFCVKYKNGKYVKIDSTILPLQYRYIPLYPSSTIGDFDADGNNEICFANEYGMLYIFEYNSTGFELEYFDPTARQGASQFFASGDTDGDGKPEIHYLTNETYDLSGVVDGANPVWSYRILKSNASDEYEIVLHEHFYGVQSGFNYKNGLTCGDVDGDGIDDVVVNVLPNAYIFKYDTEKQVYGPLWCYPASISNQSVIYDFDGNGINELGFCGFNATVFYEYNAEGQKPATPVNLQAYATDEETANVSWAKVENAEYYQLGIVNDNNMVEVFNAKLTDENIQLVKPEADVDDYQLTIVAVNESYQTPYSEFSESVILHYHKLISTAELTLVANSPLQLEVKFDGMLPRNYIDAPIFQLDSENMNAGVSPNSAMTSSDSSVVLTFNDSFAEGEYTLNIASFTDRYDSPTEKIAINFTLSDEEIPTEMYLTRLEHQSKMLVEIFFNEKVEPLTAEDISNYTLKPYGEIIGAGVSPIDSMSVQLVMSPWLQNNAARGFDMTITAQNIIAQSGNPITTGAGNTLGFVISNEGNAQAYAYPQPISLSEKQVVTFAGLTEYAEIKIISMFDGKVVNTIYENDSNGGCQWDCHDKNGMLVPPGVYLFRIKGINAAGVEKFEEIKKFVIQP